MTCWCTGRVTDKIDTVRAAVLVSLLLHAGFGWWALKVDSLKPSIPAHPIADQRMLVQLLTLPASNNPNAAVPDRPIPAHTPGKRRIQQFALTPNSELARGQPTPLQLSAGARVSLGEVQTLTPAAPAQALPILNLDTSRAVTAVEQQRRKSTLASAVDAAQSENSQTAEARAFVKLAPAGSNIVSETIMADGSRLIKFSAGGCMRVVNPSSRNHDDIRKSTMENC